MALQIWLHGKDLINNGLCPNNATWVGPATYADGKLGKCYSCTRSHCINCTYDFASTNKFTIAFWIYIPTSLSTCNQWERVFYFQNYVINWTDYNNLKIYNNSSNHLWWLNGNIFYDKWVHLAIAHNADTITLYINGDHYATVASTSSPISSGIMYAGDGITDEHGPVKFNDIRLYDHCLSPKEVKEIAKGLVLHYPLNDAYVEGTSNINNSKTITDSCYNGATRQYNYGPTTDMYKVDGIFQGKQCTKVYMGTDGLDAHPYVSFYPLHPANGAYKTLSFDYFPTICNNIVFYTYDGSATTSYVVNGIKSTISNGTKTIPVNIGQWNHIEFTLLGTSDSTSGWDYMQIGNTNHISSTSNYWLFANVQIEEKDHATPYTPNTRNETTVYDCSGYQNNGTISGSLSCSADSPRYKISTVFDGTSAKIINGSFPTSIVNGTNPFTICGWAYCIEGNSYYPLFHIGSAYRTSTGICLHENGNRIEGLDINGTKINNTYGSGYSNEKWVHQCIVYDGTTIKRYLNGNSTPVQSITCPGFKSDNNTLSVGGFWATPFKGYLSDFRVYATALSAEDIKELYNTSAYVLDNGTLLTYSAEE